jgi:hypothetical protein
MTNPPGERPVTLELFDQAVTKHGSRFGLSRRTGERWRATYSPNASDDPVLVEWGESPGQAMTRLWYKLEAFLPTHTV